jgi:hypothetical protein
MPGAFAPRFAIEAGFLILLGVGSGYADLRPAAIVALLAGGWILVSLIELAVWRSQSRPAAAHAPPPGEDVDDEEPEVAPEVAAEPEVEDDDYPLRPGAGDAPSEEVEEYTRVLSATPEERSTVQQGD